MFELNERISISESLVIIKKKRDFYAEFELIYKEINAYFL
jgi:hypothetical protein